MKLLCIVFVFFYDLLKWIHFDGTHFASQYKYYENFAFPLGALLFDLNRFSLQKWRISYPNKSLIIIRMCHRQV